MDRTLRVGQTKYRTRLLVPSDLAALQALFERAADYFRVATGAAPAKDEAARAYVAGPPSKSVDDKRIIGVFGEDGALVGVLDALVDWPGDGEWTVGMLLLDPPRRGHGLGSDVLTAFEEWAGGQGAGVVRTALVADHADGQRFLERAGYACRSTLDDYDAGSRVTPIVFYSKDV